MPTWQTTWLERNKIVLKGKLLRPAEQYLYDLQEPYRSIGLELKSVIESTLPELQLTYKWHLPFYVHDKKPFCYIHQSGDYLDLVFYHAAHFTQHLDKLEGAGRKIVRSLRYRSLEEIDFTVLIEVLQQADRVKHLGFYPKK